MSYFAALAGFYQGSEMNDMNVLSIAVRRKLAAELAKLSSNTRFTRRERAEFARMADAWMRTLAKQ